MSQGIYQALLVAARAGRLRDLTKAEAKVLLALVAHRNRQGLAWPSVATVAAESGLQERSVWRALERLIAKELVIRDGHKIVIHNGRHVRLTVYRVLAGTEQDDTLTGGADTLTLRSAGTQKAHPDGAVTVSSVASSAESRTESGLQPNDGATGAPREPRYDTLTGCAHVTGTMKSKELPGDPTHLQLPAVHPPDGENPPQVVQAQQQIRETIHNAMKKLAAKKGLPWQPR